MMAYNTDELFEIAKKAIEKHILFFVDDLVAYLPCRKPTFYDHFPVDSDRMNELKGMMYENRIQVKVSMRNKWYNSDNATLQMGLMKLIGTKEESMRLNGGYHRVEGDPENPLQVNAIFNTDILYVPNDNGTSEDSETT